MRHLFVFIVVLALLIANALCVHATTATTEDGRKVILNSDGTWKYAPAEEPKPVGINTQWTKPPKATSVLKGKAGFYELWYDPEKWTVDAKSSNPMVEHWLLHSNREGQAMVIPERLSMPVETLKRAAIENAKRAAPDLQVKEEQEITVNGKRVLRMKMFGTIQGIPLVYYGLYWTGKAGSVQAVTFTSQNLIEEFQPDFELLLSGLVITDP